MCSGRRSRIRVPGMTSFAIKPHSIGMGFSGSIEAASARRSKIKLFTDPDPKRRLGARLRVDADGRLLGDDPRAVAGLSGDGAGHLDGDGRLHRRHRRGHRVDHQDIFRRALRLDRQTQASRGHRLWAGRLHQAGIPAGAHRGLAGGRALCRSHRQGYPRRAARCVDLRYLAPSRAGRELRPAPSARYGGCLCRAAIGYRPDVVDGE